MKKRIHYYVPPCSACGIIMSVFMLFSAVLRIWLYSAGGITGSVWKLVILPVSATLLYIYIVLADGRECFYKTAISTWMICLYSGFWLNENVASQSVIVLGWIVLLFSAITYTELTSGTRYQAIWMLIPICVAAIASIFYFQREALTGLNWMAFLPFCPDVLMLLGICILVFGIKIHPIDEYHRTWGDRSDGRKIRSLPPLNQVSPYIMETRNTSTLYFEESFEITELDRYIRQKRREGLTSFGIMHVFLACYCRCIARYPGLNRFISGQKIYSRGEDIQFCMTIKKEMTAESPETEIKAHLSPRDTVYDVYKKVNDEITKVKTTPLNSDFDHTAQALMLIPGVLLRLVVGLLKLLDYFGMLPKFLLEVSCFHGSVFFTSMGSLGIPPIYHHLYDFGNLPVFGSFGCKRRATEVLEDGTIANRKYVDFKFTLDERIVDGFYYAAFFKYFKRLIQHPELLDIPPAEVIPDID